MKATLYAVIGIANFYLLAKSGFSVLLPILWFSIIVIACIFTSINKK